MKNQTLKAVVIDDEEVNLLLFEEYIKDLGMDAIVFDNALKGLEYLEKNGADLVYVDYMMPEMDGIELIKNFRKIHKTTPVIMITSSADDDALMLQALDSGATEFLLKPIRAFEFKIRSRAFMTLRASQNQLRARIEDLESQLKQ